MPNSRRVTSRRVRGGDDEILARYGAEKAIDSGTITFANLGTSPSIVQDGSHFDLTSGSGVPAATATITIPHRLGTTPSRVWLSADAVTLGFFVQTVDATNIVIGVKNAPAASTLYSFELLVS